MTFKTILKLPLILLPFAALIVLPVIYARLHYALEHGKNRANACKCKEINLNDNRALRTRPIE